MADDHYFEDGHPKTCRSCGGAVFNDIVRDFIDVGVPGGSLATEIEYVCESCGSTVAYWAYGSFDPAYYKTGD